MILQLLLYIRNLRFRQTCPEEITYTIIITYEYHSKFFEKTFILVFFYGNLPEISQKFLFLRNFSNIFLNKKNHPE